MKKLLLLLALGLSTPAWSAPPQQNAADDTDFTKAPIVWPTIKMGDLSVDGPLNRRVAAVQYLLRGRGFYKGKIDGVYGPKTVAAVKAFQKSKRLKVDGVAGPQTLPKLIVVVKRGSKGDAVRAAQLLAQGASDHVADQPNLDLKIDGVFGLSTSTAIKVAQSSIGGMEGMYAVPDGVMSARSWGLMLGGRVVGDPFTP
jgi:peptidoglycan hydrolase-like protein with peptidoglycan-binding domain